MRSMLERKSTRYEQVEQGDAYWRLRYHEQGVAEGAALEFDQVVL
jgi:hypothetical protein